MRSRHTLYQISIIFLTFYSGNIFSHDFWMEAIPYHSNPSKPVDISIHIGNEFSGDSLPNIVNWYSDFSVYQPGTKTDVEGELGRDPAGYFTPQQKGTYAIGYQSTFSFVEIDPDTFLKYLNMEGLENAIQLRQKNKLTQTPGKENYIRHAKILVQSGDSFDIDHSMINMGYELEIIPLSNPYKKKLMDKLSFRVLYQNKPIEGILLVAFSKAHPEQTQSIRTDHSGKATITLDQPGPWLVKAVKILPIKDKEADWQSHWASLTFSVSD